MIKLKVLELADKVNAQSLIGAITEQLLSSGNELYEATQTHGEIRCIRPSGEVFKGIFKAIFLLSKRLFIGKLF